MPRGGVPLGVGLVRRDGVGAVVVEHAHQHGLEERACVRRVADALERRRDIAARAAGLRERLRAAGVAREEFRDVVDAAVDDDPAVVGRGVERDVLGSIL